MAPRRGALVLAGEVVAVATSVELIGDARARGVKRRSGVFAANLKDLLLPPPRPAPAPRQSLTGIRTGVKVAVVDDSLGCGDFYHGSILPASEAGRSRHVATLKTPGSSVELVAIGNGTGSRETDRLVSMLIGEMPRRSDQGGGLWRPAARP